MGADVKAGEAEAYVPSVLPLWMMMARESGRLLARLDRPGVKSWALYRASVTARREARHLHSIRRYLT